MEKREFLPGLTPMMLVIIVAATVLMTFVSFLTEVGPGTEPGCPVDFVYVVIIVELLALAMPKFRVNAGKLVLFFIPLFIAGGGKQWMVMGAGTGESLYGWTVMTMGGSIYIRNTEPWKTLFRNFVPEWMCPTDATVLRMAWTGLRPGEALLWGAWVGPIVYVALMLCVWGLLNTFLVFAFMGKPWVETERLPFPLAVPHMYLINTASEGVASNGVKSRLFDLKDSSIKIWWITFGIGTLISSIPTFLTYVPVVPLFMGPYYGTQFIDLRPYTEATMPGTAFYFQLVIPQAIVMAILPNDILITIIVIWLAVGVMYPLIGIPAGIVPWTPGQYATTFIGNRPPFPYRIWSETGLTIGVGMWLIIMLWPRIKKVLSTLKGPDEIENGIHLRHLAIGVIGTSIFCLLFLIGSGISVIMAIYFFVLYAIWIIASTRQGAEVFWHTPVLAEWHWAYFVPFGTALGLWGSELPTTSVEKFRTLQMTFYWGQHQGSRNNPLSPHLLASIYKMGYEARIRMKDLLLGTILVTVIAAFFGQTVNIWLINHVGGASRLRASSSAAATSLSTQGVVNESALVGGYNYASHYLWTIVGIVFAIGCYLIRMRYAWFFLNPIAVGPALWFMEFHDLAALLALTGKYVLSKTFGPRMYERYAVPGISGMCLGVGMPLIFVWIYRFMTITLPTWNLYYVP